MIQELVYTSAARGLKPGSSGFCTVASTPGMALNLAQFLESLSGYRHLHTPGTPAAAANPVVHSYLRTRIGGKPFAVLSRICDAGLDYSERSNKLAHHLAMDTPSHPAGPAWLLQDGRLFLQEWSGEARRLPPRSLPSGQLPPQVCQAWQRLTGDAGWASVLLDSLSRNRPIHVVVPEGTDVLLLVREAQSLLPETERWQATFSTWYTKLPAGVECLWRFLFASTREVAAARRARDAMFLDIANLPALADSPAVLAARTGKPWFPAILPLPTDEEFEFELPSDRNDLAGLPALPPGTIANRDLRLGPPTLGETSAESKHHTQNADSFRTQKPQRTRSLFARIAALLLMVLTATAGIFLAVKSFPHKQNQPPSEPPKIVESPPEPSSPIVKTIPPEPADHDEVPVPDVVREEPEASPSSETTQTNRDLKGDQIQDSGPIAIKEEPFPEVSDLRQADAPIVQPRTLDGVDGLLEYIAGLAPEKKADEFRVPLHEWSGQPLAICSPDIAEMGFKLNFQEVHTGDSKQTWQVTLLHDPKILSDNAIPLFRVRAEASELILEEVSEKGKINDHLLNRRINTLHHLVIPYLQHSLIEIRSKNQDLYGESVYSVWLATNKNEDIQPLSLTTAKFEPKDGRNILDINGLLPNNVYCVEVSNNADAKISGQLRVPLSPELPEQAPEQNAIHVSWTQDVDADSYAEVFYHFSAVVDQTRRISLVTDGVFRMRNDRIRQEIEQICANFTQIANQTYFKGDWLAPSARSQFDDLVKDLTHSSKIVFEDGFSICNSTKEDLYFDELRKLATRVNSIEELCRSHRAEYNVGAGKWVEKDDRLWYSRRPDGSRNLPDKAEQSRRVHKQLVVLRDAMRKQVSDARNKIFDLHFRWQGTDSRKLDRLIEVTLRK